MASTINKSKKTATSKKTTIRTKKQTQIRNSGGDSGFIRSEVLIIVSFAIVVLLFLSNFHLCDVAGDFLRKVQLGIFGMVGFVVPVLLLVGTCFHLSNKGNPIVGLKIAAVVAAILMPCALAQMMFGGGYMTGQKLTESFLAPSVKGAGGGRLGALLMMPLGSALGTVGTYLVLPVLLIICIVCITEKSVVTVAKKGGDKTYQYAKGDTDRRKILHEERKEERRRLREEQKVRGVNLDSTKLVEETESRPSFLDDLEEKPDGAATAVSAALAPETAEETGGIPGARKADIFTGSITMPEQYVDDDNDTVPSDEEDEITPVPAMKMIPGSLGQVENGKEIVLKKDVRTLEEMDIVDDSLYPTEQAKDGVNYSEFFIPKEPKQMEAASGKIIKTDTEMLKKRLEPKRAEAAKDGDISMAEQIKQKPVMKKEYKFPSLNLLKRGSKVNGFYSKKEYEETAIKLQQTLQNLGVGVTVTDVSCGPSVTRYELHPEQGVKVSKIVGPTDDLKSSLAVADIRTEALIPGKSAVGIEMPNKENNIMLLRNLLEAEGFKNSQSRLSFAVGKDIGGQAVVTDVGKMPHFLIAGAIGSGKSVCINTLIVSPIYKSSPEDVKMITIDLKVVELSVYNGVPHLLIPMVTNPKKAAGALNWAVAEMMDRYKKFADYNVRDLKGYNAKAKSTKDIEDENKPQKLPQPVIIVDELADLVMVAPGEVEDTIYRLAQLARAVGIHLIAAIQRPSVNVITRLVKANVPSRIAFSVSSGVDPRTVIDMNGAERLLGKGDMPFYPAGFQKPQRV